MNAYNFLMNSQCLLQIGDFQFVVKLETEKAPETCKKFLTLLPFKNKIIQARWSGDAGWVPLGDLKLGFPVENAKNDPKAGEILLYSGDISETEIYLPYGYNKFACRDGQLKGNHFATIIQGAEQLASLGKKILWQGAQEISFSEK